MAKEPIDFIIDGVGLKTIKTITKLNLTKESAKASLLGANNNELRALTLKHRAILDEAEDLICKILIKQAEKRKDPIIYDRKDAFGTVIRNHVKNFKDIKYLSKCLAEKIIEIPDYGNEDRLLVCTTKGIATPDKVPNTIINRMYKDIFKFLSMHCPYKIDNPNHEKIFVKVAKEYLEDLVRMEQEKLIACYVRTVGTRVSARKGHGVAKLFIPKFYDTVEEFNKQIQDTKVAEEPTFKKPSVHDNVDPDDPLKDIFSSSRSVHDGMMSDDE